MQLLLAISLLIGSTLKTAPPELVFYDLYAMLGIGRQSPRPDIVNVFFGSFGKRKEFKNDESQEALKYDIILWVCDLLKEDHIKKRYDLLCKKKILVNPLEDIYLTKYRCDHIYKNIQKLQDFLDKDDASESDYSVTPGSSNGPSPTQDDDDDGFFFPGDMDEFSDEIKEENTPI